jgi:hypothetical protein
MKAPKIQRIGKKIPKKNIQPCPFLRVINPSVNATIKYRMPPPMPIPQTRSEGRASDVRLPG